MGFLDQIAWRTPQPEDVPQEGDFVRFEPYTPDPLKATPVVGMLELDQGTNVGNRRWTICYANEVADRLTARRYSTDGRLVLLGCSPYAKQVPAESPPLAPQAQAKPMPSAPDGVFGLAWVQIEAMQGGRLRR